MRRSPCEKTIDFSIALLMALGWCRDFSGFFTVVAFRFFLGDFLGCVRVTRVPEMVRCAGSMIQEKSKKTVLKNRSAQPTVVRFTMICSSCIGANKWSNPDRSNFELDLDWTSSNRSGKIRHADSVNFQRISMVGKIDQQKKGIFGSVPDQQVWSVFWTALVGWQILPGANAIQLILLGLNLSTLKFRWSHNESKHKF